MMHTSAERSSASGNLFAIRAVVVQNERLSPECRFNGFSSGDLALNLVRCLSMASASFLPAPAVPVVAAAPEQEQQHDDDEDGFHELALLSRESCRQRAEAVPNRIRTETPAQIPLHPVRSG
jgi:hypothetical protein